MITSSMEKAQSGVKIAEETSIKISEVVDKINKSATLMEEISGSSREMTASVELLSEKIGTIIKNIEITTSSALKVTDESEILRLNANKMSELIHDFN